jgi:tetratricopeptide (TPR) repeat protein
MLHLALSLTVAASSCVASSGGLLDQGYHQMYNLQFAAAHHSFAQFEKAYPGDPMGPASDAAAYLFTEFDRLKILRSDFFVSDRAMFHGKKLRPEPQNTRDFDADLQRSGTLAEAALRQNPDDAAALLATVMRLALRADFDALIGRRYWQALSEIKDANNNAEALLAKHPGCYDADLAIGFENYMLSFKPAPVRWLLSLTGAGTDRAKGIQEMRIVAEKGHYLKPYAKVLLAIAAFRRGDQQQAKEILASLAREFPDNNLFKTELKKLA